jgi:hypothetical protein
MKMPTRTRTTTTTTTTKQSLELVELRSRLKKRPKKSVVPPSGGKRKTVNVPAKKHGAPSAHTIMDQQFTMRHHFRHPQAMFNKGSLFYSHCY